MAVYVQQTWEPGTAITEEKLLHMEQGIYNAFGDRGLKKLTNDNINLDELTDPGVYVLTKKESNQTINYENWPTGLSDCDAIIEVLLASRTTIQRLTPLASSINSPYFIRYKKGTSVSWSNWENLKEKINSFLKDEEYVFKGYKILSSGSVDDVTDTGFYFLPDTDNFVYTGLPQNIASSYKILEVFQLSETGATIMQRLTVMSTGDQYIRYSVKNAEIFKFLAWTRVIDSNQIDLINERIDQFPQPDTILNNYGILGVPEQTAINEGHGEEYPAFYNDTTDYKRNNDINSVLNSGFYFLPGTSTILTQSYKYMNLPSNISLSRYKLLEVFKFTNNTIVQRITVPLLGEQYTRQIIKSYGIYTPSDWTNKIQELYDLFNLNLICKDLSDLNAYNSTLGKLEGNSFGKTSLAGGWLDVPDTTLLPASTSIFIATLTTPEYSGKSLDTKASGIQIIIPEVNGTRSCIRRKRTNISSWDSWEFLDGFPNRGVLSTGTDLNQLIYSGYYLLGGANGGYTYLNLPDDELFINGNKLLEVFYHTNNSKTQRITLLSKNIIYYRTISNVSQKTFDGVPWETTRTDKIVENLKKYNSYDILKEVRIYSNAPSHGITYTWNNDICTVEGATEADSASANLFLKGSWALFPSEIIPGNTYYVRYHTTDKRVRLRIIYRESLEAQQSIRADYFTEDKEIIIPENATAWHIGLLIDSNINLQEPVIVSDIAILSCEDRPWIKPQQNNYYNTERHEYSYTNTYNINCSPTISTSTENFLPADGYICTINGTSQNGQAPDSVFISRQGLPANVIPGQSYYIKRDEINNQTSILIAYYDESGNRIGNDYTYTLINTNSDIIQIPNNTKKWSMAIHTASAEVTYNNLTLTLPKLFETENPDVDLLKGASIFVSDKKAYGITFRWTTRDRTGDIQSILDATKVCHLGPGLFTVTGIELQTGRMLIGSGNSTVIRLSSEVQNGCAIKLNSFGCVKDLSVQGEAPPLESPSGDATESEKNNLFVYTAYDSFNIGGRDGIRFEGTLEDFATYNPNVTGSPRYRACIDDVWISYCHGGGIVGYNTGGEPASNMLISNTHIWKCDAGIYIPRFSEFHQYTNVSITNCYYGCYCTGGNNLFSNCNLSTCIVGLWLNGDGSYADRTVINDAHGLFSNCKFAHNVQIAIKMTDLASYEAFTGVSIGSGGIYIKNCSDQGAQFTGCRMTGSADIHLDNAGHVFFIGTIFKDSTANKTTFINSSHPHFINCYNTRTGVAYNPA